MHITFYNLLIIKTLKNHPRMVGQFRAKNHRTICMLICNSLIINTSKKDV